MKLHLVMMQLTIAFGDDAINKGYTQEDVINRLMDYSNIALQHEDN